MPTAKEFAAEEQTPEKDSAQKEDPLRNTQWDSDWDSDFSLHIQPLSDLSASSSEEEQWKNGIHRNVNSAVAVEQQLGRNSDKINKDSLTTKEGAWRQEVPKRMLNAGAHDQVTETRNNKEANREERKQRRKIVVKPIPSLGPGMLFCDSKFSISDFSFCAFWLAHQKSFAYTRADSLSCNGYSTNQLSLWT